MHPSYRGGRDHPVTLFDLEPVCGVCEGKRYVMTPTGDRRACPSCASRPDPSRNSEGMANRSSSGAPETQRAAARSIRGVSGSMRQSVLTFVTARAEHGATDEEIESGLRLRHQSASARRHELVRDGWLQDSGQRRLTSSGRKAVVWVAVANEEVTL